MSRKMTTFQVIAEDGKIIKIDLREGGEYEFSLVHDYLEYTGRSFLKNLEFVEEMQEYLDSQRPQLKYSPDKIVVELPVPFSRKLEIVELAKPIINEN